MVHPQNLPEGGPTFSEKARTPTARCPSSSCAAALPAAATRSAHSVNSGRHPGPWRNAAAGLRKRGAQKRQGNRVPREKSQEKRPKFRGIPTNARMSATKREGMHKGKTSNGYQQHSFEFEKNRRACWCLSKPNPQLPCISVP